MHMPRGAISFSRIGYEGSSRRGEAGGKRRCPRRAKEAKRASQAPPWSPPNAPHPRHLSPLHTLRGSNCSVDGTLTTQVNSVKWSGGGMRAVVARAISVSGCCCVCQTASSHSSALPCTWLLGLVHRPLVMHGAAMCWYKSWGPMWGRVATIHWILSDLCCWFGDFVVLGGPCGSCVSGTRSSTCAGQTPCTTCALCTLWRTFGRRTPTSRL